MTIEEAKSYLNYCIKEGVFDSDQLSGLSDEELIEFAEHEMAVADAYADAQKEQDVIE